MFLVSRIVPKNVKGALWLFFNIHAFAKVDPSETLKKLRKKVSQCRKKSTQKIWSRAGLEPMSFRLADLKKP